MGILSFFLLVLVLVWLLKYFHSNRYNKIKLAFKKKHNQEDTK